MWRILWATCPTIAKTPRPGRDCTCWLIGKLNRQGLHAAGGITNKICHRSWFCYVYVIRPCFGVRTSRTCHCQRYCVITSTIVGMWRILWTTRPSIAKTPRPRRNSTRRLIRKLNRQRLHTAGGITYKICHWRRLQILYLIPVWAWRITRNISILNICCFRTPIRITTIRREIPVRFCSIVVLPCRPSTIVITEPHLCTRSHATQVVTGTQVQCDN